MSGIVHRFIPAAHKHGDKTACGMKLVETRLINEVVHDGMTRDGRWVAVSSKGKNFDCRRCRSVLEAHHKTGAPVA